MAELARANARLEETTRIAERTEAAVKDIGSGFNLAPVLTELKILNEQLRTTKREANETHRAIRDLGSGGAGGALGGLASLFPGGGRATGGALAVGVGAAAVSIAPLLPALGALAVAPAMLLTLAAAAGVAKVAFGGMGAAIDGNRKAYNELNAQQKQFVNMIRGQVIPLLNGLKQTITSNIFGPITSAIRSVTSNQTALANINGIVRELARGFGQMAASWVRFLGSTAMTRQIGQMFAAWLPVVQALQRPLQSMFQSFVRIETALAPLGQFLVDAFSKGAKAIADWITQAQKTGEFAHIIQTIEQSLRLLWSTVKTVANVFGALYTALAPIGRVVLPDILSGLNFVAGLIRQNAALIDRDFVGAWKAVVAVVRLLGPLIGPLLKTILTVLGQAIEAVGRFAQALQFLRPIISFLSTMINRFGKYVLEAFLGPTTLIVANWSAMGTALGQIAVSIANAFIQAINAIGSAFASVANVIISGYNAIFGWAFGNINSINIGIGQIKTNLSNVGAAESAAQRANDRATQRNMTPAERHALGSAIQSHLGGGGSTIAPAPTVNIAQVGRNIAPPPPSVHFQPFSLHGGAGATPFSGGGGGGGGRGGGGGAVGYGRQNALQAAEIADKTAQTTNNLHAQIAAAEHLAAVAQATIVSLKAQHDTGKRLHQDLIEEARAANDILRAHREIAKARKELVMEAITAKDKALLAPFGSIAGGPSALQTVRATFAGIQAQVRAGTATLTSSMTREMTVIGRILKDKIVPPEIVSILRNRLAQIRTMISAEAQAMQGVASALSSLGSQAMSAFDAINANWQSPAGKQLAQMQKEDQARQLKQALDDAISQYGADSQQAKDAQRAIDEAMLAQQAADQQTAHDQALKAQKDQFEKEYAGLEKQIQRQHLTAEEAAKRLRALYKKYGLTPDSVQAATDWNTAQSLFVQGMSDLVAALNNLYTAITGKAAPGSGGGGGGGSPGPATKPPGGDFLPNPKFDPRPGSPGWDPGSIKPGQPWWPHGGFAHGGLIDQMYGPGAIPIVAHAGEYVINAKSARRLGLHNLSRLNSYGDGGPVLPPLGPNQKLNPETGVPDVPAYRAAAMYLNDYGRDKNETAVVSALIGSLGPRAQAQAALRDTTTFDGRHLGRGTWRAPMPDAKLLARLLAAYPGIVFETGTPGQQISAAQAVSRIPGGWGSVAGLIQASMGFTGGASQVERMTSHAIHFAKGYTTDARNAATALDLAGRSGHNAPGFYGMAAGGIVKGGRGGLLAWIGEGQHDEMVTPLPAGGAGQHTGQIAEFHIYIDGDKVEKTVTKRQLRNARYGNPGIAPATR